MKSGTVYKVTYKTTPTRDFPPIKATIEKCELYSNKEIDPFEKLNLFGFFWGFAKTVHDDLVLYIDLEQTKKTQYWLKIRHNYAKFADPNYIRSLLRKEKVKKL